MRKLRKHVIGVLAAATVAAAALAAPAPASAMTNLCLVKTVAYWAYMATAEALRYKDVQQYQYWRGMADGVVQGC